MNKPLVLHPSMVNVMDVEKNFEGESLNFKHVAGNLKTNMGAENSNEHYYVDGNKNIINKLYQKLNDYRNITTEDFRMEKVTVTSLSMGHRRIDDRPHEHKMGLIIFLDKSKLEVALNSIGDTINGGGKRRRRTKRRRTKRRKSNKTRKRKSRRTKKRRNSR